MMAVSTQENPPTCGRDIYLFIFRTRNGTPSGFHTTVATSLTSLPLVSAEALEQCLVVAGRNHGRRGFQQLRFVSSRLLTDLRFRRRQTNDPQEQKQLSFQIRKVHRKELRDWKSNQTERLLEQSSKWKILRTMDYGTGRWLPEQPQPFEFADMLEQLFAGNPGRPMVEPCLTEAPWTMAELKKAITRLKTNKVADDVGLVAELLHHSPEVMLEALLHLFRTVLFTGEVPETWKQTVFNMLPKTRGAKSTSDFRPIAVVRMLYNAFAYLVLGRIEATLDAGQPEEQHGFRADRRIEEHLLTTNLVLDKTLSLDVPMWIVSLDLSKAFDKVKWENLWEALGEHGVSDHMLWVLQCMYYGQTGRIGDNSPDGGWFCIRGGVRQGCVLSPRLFSCVLEVALGCWRRKVGNAGISSFTLCRFGAAVHCCSALGYCLQWLFKHKAYMTAGLISPQLMAWKRTRMHTLLDLRFADDILLLRKHLRKQNFC